MTGWSGHTEFYKLGKIEMKRISGGDIAATVFSNGIRNRLIDPDQRADRNVTCNSGSLNQTFFGRPRGLATGTASVASGASGAVWWRRWPSPMPLAISERLAL